MLNTSTEQIIEQIHASPIKLVLEVAGAGSLALFWLHNVAGSSRTILEATDRYAPASLVELIGHMPEKFVSVETAQAMAIQAYRRARRLQDDATCIGVACSATIATNRLKRGDHGCWVAVYDGKEVHAYGLVLTKGQRDRLAEEVVVSQVLLHAIAVECQVTGAVEMALIEGERVEMVSKRVDDPVASLLDERAQSVTVLPDGQRIADQPVQGALLSGSFNPLHAGHERLAAASEQALGLPVAFELPVVNADKPTLSYAEIERRLGQFLGRYTVVLSRAPLFREKATLFPGCVFIVGYDTALRLVDPHYYGGEAGRDTALEDIRARGCRFLVAGRVHDGAFRTLADLVIPGGFEDLFIALPENAFRVDLSSTEMRARFASANRS